MTDHFRPVPFPNSYWVIPGKFLAGEHPGDADREAAARRLSTMLDAGVRAFLDLTDEDEKNEDVLPVPHYRSLLRSLAEDRALEVTYLRIPIVDRGIPSVWTMRCALDVIDRCVADENIVYVHCWAGRGRTGTVVGCYLRRHDLVAEADVIRHIADLRQRMPSRHDSSPHTPKQVRMVKTWKSGV